MPTPGANPVPVPDALGSLSQPTGSVSQTTHLDAKTEGTGAPPWGATGLPLASLTAMLSRARLARYLSACAGDTRMAIECHYWNTQLGHALYFPLQTFELLLRNTLNTALAKEFGTDWLVQHPAWLGDLPGKENRQRKKIESAIDKIFRRHGVAYHNKLLAELDISFWAGLLSSRYIVPLWTPYLHKLFPHHPSGSGEHVGKRAEQIRDLRNRVAHHEPVIFASNRCNFLDGSTIRRQYEDIIEAIGWICPDTKEFVAARCEFEEVVSSFIDFLQRSSSADYGGVAAEVPWTRPIEGRLHIVRASVKFYDATRAFGYLKPEPTHMRDLRVEEKVLHSSGLEMLVKKSPVEAAFRYVRGFPEVLQIRLL